MFSLLLIFSTHGAFAGGVGGKSGEELAQIALGGNMYDKWAKLVEGNSPKGTHPIYAESKGKQKGKGTWRCKECHGWDYMGKDGAYASGSHFSGISGIRGNAGQSVGQVVAALKGNNHGLDKFVSQAELETMAKFVVFGQLDMDHYIDRSTKMAKGDIENGGRIFLTFCTKCHGDDGKEINFKNEKKPEYVGTVANKNPWETLHKIRVGQPDEDMPAMIAFPIQLQVDVLAYTQTLPVK